MKIILHLGMHGTDEGRLMQTLGRNRDPFQRRGVLLPPPSRYRVLLREAIHKLAQGPAAPDSREILLDAIMEDDEGDRLILSNDNFFGIPRMAIANGEFYPAAEERLADLRELFPGVEIELFLAIRDPGMFIPALMALSPGTSLDQMLGGTDPGTLRWSSMIRRMRFIAPDMPITVWCNEDTPLIWAEIVRAMAGLEPGEKIKGGFDLLQEIMSPEGMKRFRAYFKEHPVMTERQKRRVMAAFLDKYAQEDALQDSFDMPDWPEEVYEYLTDAYEDDLRHIASQPGVTLIAP